MGVREKTLHELFSNSFNRSPNGAILTRELKTVFSILIICLSLEQKPRTVNNRLLKIGKRQHSYTFSIEQAVQLLQNLELNVEMNSTSIHISYSIKPELGHQLLDTFMEAKLLHTPADKTRSRPKEGILLQPSAKGVAVVCEYATKFALKDIPPILLSNFNSMNPLKFERNTSDDSVIQSEYFINLLFSKMMGPVPNVWSPKDAIDELPKLSTLLDQRSSDIFSFENVSMDRVLNGINDKTECVISELSQSFTSDSDSGSPSLQQLDDEQRESPFAHRFFSNPDSDSHIQYYVSDRGLRVVQNKTFGHKNVTIDYCFTTKALWQWLMECTDIMYPREAVSVAALFLKYGLITPILLPPSQNNKRKFTISKNSYYTLSDHGWDVIRWRANGCNKNAGHTTVNSIPGNKEDIGVRDDEQRCAEESSDGLHLACLQRQASEKISFITGTDSSSDSTETVDEDLGHEHSSVQLSLKQVLADPGMRYLFRGHLCNEFCSENLDVYFEIVKFLKRMTVLRKIIESRDHTEDNSLGLLEWKKNGKTKLKVTIQSALLRQTNECLSLVYHIYSSFIAPGAPHQLNIDHDVRDSITKIIFHPQSPTRTAFSIAATNDDASASDSVQNVSRTDEMENNNNSSPAATIPLTPAAITRYTDTYVIEHALSMLKDLYGLMEIIKDKVYKMMKNDSLPKFFETESFKEAISLICTQKQRTQKN